MFNGLTLIKKLNELLNELPNQVDKDLIKKVISNNVNLTIAEFDISTIPVGLYSNKDISTHTYGVNKCFYYAVEFVYLNYNKFDPYSQYEEDERFYDIRSGHTFEDIEKYMADLRLIRCHVYRTCDKDIKEDIVDSLDLQITELFIKRLLSYKLLCNWL